MGIVAKLVYTAVLLGVGIVIARELWLIWRDPTVYIGRFTVVSGDGQDDTASALFAKRILAAQEILGHQFNNYQTRRSADSPNDATFVLASDDTFRLPPEALGGVDITVQNVNLRQVLSELRKSFLSRNEITGQIVATDGSVLGTVEWPSAPSIDGQPESKQFLIPNQTSEQAAAAYIAWSLSWTRAAAVRNSPVASYGREQFSDFGAALRDLYELGEKASTPSGLSAEEVAVVRRHSTRLRSYYSASSVFPELHRLRADLLDLLPESAREPEELVEVQEERVRYTMLSPEIRKLPEDQKQFAALALARPAIPLGGKGGLVNPPENWAKLLQRAEKEIRVAETSVGLVLLDGKPAGTGFIVAPGLLMTADHVVAKANKSTLCVGRSERECGASFDLGDVVYPPQGKRSPVTLLELHGHDPIFHPPFVLAEPLPAANALIGQYAYVIGYAFRDPRMPEPYLARLLGEEPGIRRLMPGRILAFGPRTLFGYSGGGPASFTSDISTTAGTSGAPLVELTTGRVIGVSYAGMWQGERGKFAYAEPIPEEALKLIAQRLRGEEPAKPLPAPLE